MKKPPDDGIAAALSLSRDQLRTNLMTTARIHQPDFPRPMSHAPTPDELERMADDMVTIAARGIPALTLGTMGREAMGAAAATARVAGCVFILPTSQRPAQLVPMSVWEEAKRLTEEARQMRCARVARRVMAMVRRSA